MRIYTFKENKNLAGQPFIWSFKMNSVFEWILLIDGRIIKNLIKGREIWVDKVCNAFLFKNVVEVSC